jgi:phosphoribosyl-ATP pyrophosphohydrolase
MTADYPGHDPLGHAAFLGEALNELAKTIDARAGADPSSSWTAKLLAGGPPLTAKKLGEEGVEAALAIVAQGDKEVAGEAADVIYHLLVALRSRGVSLDAVAAELKKRQGKSGVEEKASRPQG